MTFIRKHKVLIGFSLLFVVTLFVIIIRLINSSKQNEIDKYGSRIKGIENVQISDSKVEDIKRTILTNTSVNKITYRLDGKIIKFFIEVKKDTEELNIEDILYTMYDKFNDSEKKFYDFQVFIVCEEKKEFYPVIAYKHRNNEAFTITRKEGSNNEE